MLFLSCLRNLCLNQGFKYVVLCFILEGFIFLAFRFRSVVYLELIKSNL